jgi:uncharacterized phage infection (PIP) family protein YhgE
MSSTQAENPQVNNDSQTDALSKLADLAEQFRKESEKESLKLKEAMNTIQTNIHNILSHREKEVQSFYDELDRWEYTTAMSKHDRCLVLYEKLAELPEEYDDYFFTLHYFVTGKYWKLDRTTDEYKTFEALTEDSDPKTIKMAALNLLPFVDYEGIRRFIDEIIGDGVLETYFVF